jgi:histidyl-tRNA synthetase
LIFGPDELAQGMVTVKALRDGAGAQVQRPLAAIADWAATLKA